MVRPPASALNERPDPDWADLAFALSGAPLPRAHRQALHAALAACAPWLADVAGLAVHPLKLSGDALLSRRTRLVLRLPRAQAERARALEGARLQRDGIDLQLGPASVRPLQAWGTLYAHFVADTAQVEAQPAAPADEAAFLDAVARELQALGVRGRAICGRRQVLAGEAPGAALVGYGLMIDGLSETDSLTLLHAGLGPHRQLGCGVFVPHKSAAAVGTAP